LRLALWTPRLRTDWWGRVAARLRLESALEVVAEPPPEPPAADVHVYDLADDPAHGFVYRALLSEPGLVVLASWSLHRLVHAETAGRGDVPAYCREARRMHGETGSFVAEQVLRGRGGALPSVLPWNDRVLAGSLALATTGEEVRRRAASRLGRRPLVRLPAQDPETAASHLLSLARTVLAAGERLRREAAADRAAEGTLLALALDELRPAAHALALPSLPDDVRELLAGLLPGER
jgi:hypothetical protein